MYDPRNSLTHSLIRLYHVQWSAHSSTSSNPVRLRHLQWLHVPDSIAVLIDTAIAREEAHPANASDALSDPFLLILVRLVDQILRLAVAVEVVRHQIIITMVNNAINKSRELASVTKFSRFDHLEDILQISVYFESGAIKMVVSEIIDVFRQVAEEENVVFTNLSCDFDIGTIAGACIT